MSKFAKDGNSFRREWDKEAFEKRAKERLERETELEEEREAAKTAPQPIVQRAPLQRRTEDLQLTKYVGTRQMVSGADAMSGNMEGSYYCSVCECALRDSANYLAHINGRKHNRMLGMSMRAERSTLAEVRARLQAHKDDDALKQELSPEEKAELFLQQFDERVREREEAEREEAREKRRRDKERRAGAAPAAPTGGAEEAAGGGAEAAAEADADDGGMAAMGFNFGGFGGSRKNN